MTFAEKRRKCLILLIFFGVTGLAGRSADAQDEAGTQESPSEESGPEEAPEVITIEGQSRRETLLESDRAVSVIQTDRDRKKAADMGEILARTQGISVRRSGGLGSGTRFALNGLTDDQIRFFIDGVPLDFAGFTFGIANVPLNLVERIEVYRGVVPVEFGADALGGAVNLVSSYVDGTAGSASYLVGSFGTHRLTGDFQIVDQETGWLTRATGFFDAADNDYSVDVDVTDESGDSFPATVDRFHDDYQAGGAQIEVGVVEREWAERLTVKGFYSDFDRDIQNNVVMTVPYGDARYFERTAGALLRYVQPLTDHIRLDATGGYTRERTRFSDQGECVYSWFGECTRARPRPGEIETPPSEQVIWDDNFYARVNATIELFPDHDLQVSIAPTSTERTGEDRLLLDPDGRDPLSAERRLFAVVAGAEYRLRLFEDRLANTFFVKGYVQALRSEEVLPGNTFQQLDRDTERLGVGNSLRFRVTEHVSLKASYEYATRLPRVDETFGDGVLIVPNLDVAPEKSHNVNLGAVAEYSMPFGVFNGEVNGFLRESDDLIVLLSNDRFFIYQNVFGARSLGVEGSLQWSFPGEWLVIGGNGTYLDFRNTSSEGTFGDFDGDRIPNRPYGFANGFARLQFEEVVREFDSLSLDWNTRYVHEFFRGWESVGRRDFKETVDSQLSHTAALIYSVAFWPYELSFTAEVQNLTNADLFDFFGVQRPGRAFLFKTTAEL